MRLIIDDYGFNVGMMVSRTDVLQGCLLLLSSGVHQRLACWISGKVSIVLHVTLWLRYKRFR